MILFFDTSALIKRYIAETGSGRVDELFQQTTEIVISPVTKIELHSTIKRLVKTNALSKSDYQQLKKDIANDINDFINLSFNSEIEDIAFSLIERHQLKTLDSIQLASCLYSRADIDGFVVSDAKLKKASQNEGLIVIDPLIP